MNVITTKTERERSPCVSSRRNYACAVTPAPRWNLGVRKILFIIGHKLDSASRHAKSISIKVNFKVYLASGSFITVSIAQRRQTIRYSNVWKRNTRYFRNETFSSLFRFEGWNTERQNGAESGYFFGLLRNVDIFFFFFSKSSSFLMKTNVIASTSFSLSLSFVSFL